MLKLILRTTAFIIAAAFCCQSLAQTNEKARFRYSLWTSEMNAKMEVSSGTTYGNKFDLNDLAMDKKEVIPVWELEMWQGSTRLDISYWENKWDGYAQVNHNIVFEAINYNISDIVDSSFKMKTTDASLTFALARSFNANFGLVCGMKYIEYYVRMWNITGAAEAREQVIAPVPYMGISLETMLGETILGGRFVMFQYAYGGTNVDVGNYYQVDAYLEFRAGTSVALRIGFHNMVLSYENKSAGDKFKITQIMKGTYASIYLSF